MGGLFGAIGDFVVGQALNLLLPSLGAVIAGYVIRLLHRQLEKVGIQMTDQQEARVRQIVQDILQSVEELARRREDLTSPQKRAIAAQEIKAALPTLTTDQIEQAIDAQLPVVRTKLALPAYAANPGLPGGGRR